MSISVAACLVVAIFGVALLAEEGHNAE